MITAPARVLVVMGVSGTGKTTLALGLAERLGWPFQEGDDLHPPVNVARMAAGTPLGDADRAPWLATVRAWIDARLDAGESGVVTCSALKRAYRDVLRREGVVFVHVTGDRAVIAERMGARAGHYMPLSLLDSQLAILEAPDADERVVTVGVDGAPAEQLERALAGLGADVVGRP